jgi:O-antigen/teichoic acid export membrane protein
MSRIRSNIVANAIGRGWSTLIGVAVLPLYVRFLGAEAYGLVGLYATIAVICSLFDAGISASLGRELARAAAEEDAPVLCSELVRTAEVLYFSIGLFLGAGVALSAPVIASRWLNLHDVSVQDATRAVRLMGLLIVFQWSTGLYVGALNALQRQVTSNLITSIVSGLRAVGAVVVVWKVSSTIVAFYWWQVLSTAVYLLVSREAVWRAAVVQRRLAAFRWSVALRVRRFAAGVTLLSFASVVSSQLDKVVLTRVVSLEAFGYYSFAVSVAGAVTSFGQPVVAALYPAMVAAFTRRDSDRLADLFHRGAQLVSVLTFAPAAVLCAFSPTVLRLWARGSSTAANASVLVSACLVGPALNCAAVTPFNLTLAAGRVGPAMLVAGCGIVISSTTLWALAPRIGVLAGAVSTALVSVTSLFVYARFGIKHLLPGHAWRWVRIDVLAPFAAAALVASLVRVGAMSQASPSAQMVGLLLASVATLTSATALTPAPRKELLARVRSLLHRGNVDEQSV